MHRLGREWTVLVALTVATTKLLESAYAAPGDLDPTFGTAGVVTTTFASRPLAIASATSIAPDGTIAATGYAASNQANARIAVARYTANGSHDLGFSADGRTFLDLGQGFATIAMADGRTLVSGVTDLFSFAPLVSVARLLADGSFDPSFSGGVVEIDFGVANPFAANGLAIQSDGRIVIGTDYGVARLEDDGDLDTTFGGDGIVNGPGGYVVIQPDDKIVVANSPDGDFEIARYESNGTLDSGFGVGGVVTTDFAGGQDAVRALALQGSAIVVAGVAETGTGQDFAVARYEADGDLDPTFSGDGKVTTDFGGQDEGYGLVLRNDGRMVVIGVASGSFALARYESDGDLDPTFDGDGRVTRPMFARIPLGVTADGEDRALVGGGALGFDGWTIGRVLLGDCSNGTLDPGEACDEGAANGLPTSCCTSSCQLRAAAEVCRPAAGACDVEEACTGASASCPADMSAANGTTCNDGDPCTRDDACTAGSCAGTPDPDACIDDYLCYKSRITSGTPKFASVDGLAMVDDLESGAFDVKKPTELCAPGAKNGVPAIDDDTHQLSYAIKAAHGEPKHVKQVGLIVTDSFGTLSLDTVKPDRLLAAANKVLGAPAPPPSPGLDHYKCYKVKVSAGTPKLAQGTQAAFADQFEDRLYRIVKPSRLCSPVSIGGGTLQHPSAHILCYVARAAAGEPSHTKVVGTIHTTDRFGSLRLDTVREAELCVPALVSP